MINSRSTPDEIRAEYKRLKLELAVMDNQFIAFTLGACIEGSITDLEDRYYQTNLYFKDVEKRFSRLPLSI